MICATICSYIYPNFDRKTEKLKNAYFMSRNHEYFERNPEAWNIIDFLNECEIEPYDAKIDKYTKSLKAIANDQQGEKAEKAEKAQSLLDRFILASKKFL